MTMAGDRQATAAQADAASGPLFELDPSYVNLTTFVLASHPRPVREAIERHRRELDENAALYLRERRCALEEAARTALAEYLEAGPDEIALTDSTTMGVALTYARLRLAPGEEVVTSEHDFFATHESLRLRERARRRDGPARAPVRRAGVGVGRRDRRGGVARARPAHARLALTWVHSSSGVKLPLREIARRWPTPTAGGASASASSCAWTACTASASRTRPRPISASTSSPPAATSGCSARAAPGSSGPRRTPGPARAHDPVLRPARVQRVDRGPPAGRRAAGRADDARRLPLVRAPLGAARGGRGPRRAGRPHGGGAADARARAAELKDGLAGIGGVRLRTTARRGAVGRARVLRGEGNRPRRGRWTACARSTGWWRA